ncbi:MAG: RNA polymerase sigma factor [Acidimicrobiales bacterium]
MATTDLGRLVLAAAGGDEAAWHSLVDRLGPYVLAVTRACGLNDGSDVSQTCFLRLVENIGRLEDPDRVASWLGTTARRECQALKHRSRRVVSLADDAEPEPPGGPLPPPDSGVLADERGRALWAAFARLSPRDQALLRLRSTDPPMPYLEIAATLQMAKGSVGPTVGRAVTHLRQQIQLLGVDPENLRP